MSSSPVSDVALVDSVPVDVVDPKVVGSPELDAAVMDSDMSAIMSRFSPLNPRGGRRSPAVACWASDHWVASSNPPRGKFRH